jgi:hypothetical protein
MSGSSESWGGRGGKRKTPSNPESKDAELKTEKGTPKRPAEELGRARGSDPI